MCEHSTSSPEPGAEHDSGKHRGKPDTLHSAVKTWPTPRASMSHGAGEHGQVGKDLQTDVGGTLNPTWVAWLMAFPLGWLNSRLWETRKSRFKRPSRGKS